MTRPDKQALLDLLRSRVEQELRTLWDSQKAAQEGAIHEETRQEDPKDTRAIEAQYIARGLAERVEELHDSIARLSRLPLETFGPDDPIDLSALVGLKDGEERRVYFLVPVAGGETLAMDGTTVRTLTPSSPLGHALRGLCVDDDVGFERPSRSLLPVVEWVH